MLASEIFEAQADYRFLERRFEQRINDLWNLAPDDPDGAMQIAGSMQAWLHGHQKLPMTQQQRLQNRYLLGELYNFISFMRS